MASLPGLLLEDFIAWYYNIVVIGAPEANPSLLFAELMGNIPHRPALNQEEFSSLISLFEPYRESVEDKLLDFDEEYQSWRDYSPYVEIQVPEEVLQEGKNLISKLTERKTGD